MRLITYIICMIFFAIVLYNHNPDMVIKEKQRKFCESKGFQKGTPPYRNCILYSNRQRNKTSGQLEKVKKMIDKYKKEHTKGQSANKTKGDKQ